MKGFTAPNMIQLHDNMAKWFIDARPKQFTTATTIEAGLYDVVAEAKTMEWDYDLKKLWLTKSRWDAMVKQYVDPDKLEAWLTACQGIMSHNSIKTRRGTAILRANEVLPRGGQGRSNVTRKWGGCMLYYSFKANPHPQITMHSRTSYLGYLSALDMSIAWQLGRYLVKAIKEVPRRELELTDIKFVWHLEVLQWHYFKSLAYLFNHPDQEEAEYFFGVLTEEKLHPSEEAAIAPFPIQWGSRLWTQRFLREDREKRTYGEMSYNTFRRVRRRFHTEQLGLEYAKQFNGSDEKGRQHNAFPPLPSLLISELDFSTIGMPL